MKKISLAMTVLAILFSLDGFAQCDRHKARAIQTKHVEDLGHKDIVDIASSNDDFSTLVAAVAAADLVSTLKSEGPFTVFAPTNTAFAKLPEGTVEGLLEPKAKADLTAILTYHVGAAKISAETLVNAIAAAGDEFVMNSVNGGKLTAKIMNGNPVLIDAQGNKSFITSTDINASNGVIHVIDTVVMP